MSAITNGKLSLGTKVGYSIGTFGECVAYNFYYLFFMYFLIDYAGVGPAIAGTISLIAVVWDAVTDPYIGHLSDTSKNPNGKRRPWIIKFSVPLGIVVLLLFTNVPLTGTAQVLYFIVINILFWVVFTAVDIPYMVLGGEISRDHEERLSLRWMCSSFNYFGYGIAGYAFLLLAKFEETFGNANAAWSATALIMGVLIAGSFIVSYFATKGKEPINEVIEEEKVNVLKSVIEGFKIKPYRNILLYTLFAFTGIMLYTSAQVYLFEKVIGASETTISNIYVIYALMVVILSPIMGKLGKVIGNKNTLIFSVIFITIGFGIYKFIPLTMVTVWGILLACGVGVAGFFVNSYAMIYDIADVAELKTGLKNEGVLISFFSFMIKLGTALGMWLLGIFFSLYRYDPEAITSEAMDGIISTGTIIPAVICGISVFFLFGYSLNEKNIRKLRQMKQDHNDGKEIDLAEVSRLL